MGQGESRGGGGIVSKVAGRIQGGRNFRQEVIDFSKAGIIEVCRVSSKGIGVI